MGIGSASNFENEYNYPDGCNIFYTLVVINIEYLNLIYKIDTYEKNDSFYLFSFRGISLV